MIKLFFNLSYYSMFYVIHHLSKYSFFILLLIYQSLKLNRYFHSFLYQLLDYIDHLIQSCYFAWKRSKSLALLFFICFDFNNHYFNWMLSFEWFSTLLLNSFTLNFDINLYPDFDFAQIIFDLSFRISFYQS